MASSHSWRLSKPGSFGERVTPSALRDAGVRPCRGSPAAVLGLRPSMRAGNERYRLGWPCTWRASGLFCQPPGPIWPCLGQGSHFLSPLVRPRDCPIHSALGMSVEGSCAARGAAARADAQ
eukprot:scaffold74675_cov39-Phaeocystis_antarctica.AAC.1